MKVYKGFEKFVNGTPASKGTPAVVVAREACMEAIIAILLEEGGLVPLAKKYVSLSLSTCIQTNVLDSISTSLGNVPALASPRFLHQSYQSGSLSSIN